MEIVVRSGRSRRGPRPPPLFLDHTEARRAEKSFFETGLRSYLRVWMTAPLPPPPPPPLSEGVDPPLVRAVR